jgi:hypothetical protein
MVRRVSDLRGPEGQARLPSQPGELSRFGRAPGPGRRFMLRLAASSQICFRSNVPEDCPVVDSSLGSKFPGLRRPMEF